jgi:hypothetical protein
MPNIRVNVRTLDDLTDSDYDWASFNTEDVKETIHRFFEGGKQLGADSVSVFDCTPDFHFKDEEACIYCVQLVVSCLDGDFWWEGYYKHCDSRFKTHRLTLKDLDITEDTDKREHIE